MSSPSALQHVHVCGKCEGWAREGKYDPSLKVFYIFNLCVLGLMNGFSGGGSLPQL